MQSNAIAKTTSVASRFAIGDEKGGGRRIAVDIEVIIHPPGQCASFVAKPDELERPVSRRWLRRSR